MFQAGPYGYAGPHGRQVPQFQQYQGQANQFPYPIQQPIQQPVPQVYQQQTAYPPVYPQYWQQQQPVYQGYPQQWQQPPLQTLPMYYQPSQTPQQQRASQSEYDDEPTMEELHWASLEKEFATYVPPPPQKDRQPGVAARIYDAPLARDDYYNQSHPQSSSYLQLTREQAAEEAKYYEELERELKHLKQKQLQRERKRELKLKQSMLKEELERSMQKELDVEKEKLSEHLAHSMDDEVIAATEELKDEEKKIDENTNNFTLQSQPKKTTSNNSLCFPLQVADSHEDIPLDTNLLELVAIEEDEYKDINDEALQALPTISIVDVPIEDFIFPHFPNQNMVITCNLTFPFITYTVVSSYLQNFLIKEALGNKSVMGSLINANLHLQVVGTHRRSQKLEMFLGRLCTNWKIRKKRQCMSLSGEVNCLHGQRSHLVFAWKPGLDSWLDVAGKIIKNTRRKVRKFELDQPWDPNL